MHEMCDCGRFAIAFNSTVDYTPLCESCIEIAGANKEYIAIAFIRDNILGRVYNPRQTVPGTVLADSNPNRYSIVLFSSTFH